MISHILLLEAKKLEKQYKLKGVIVIGVHKNGDIDGASSGLTKEQEIDALKSGIDPHKHAKDG